MVIMFTTCFSVTNFSVLCSYYSVFVFRIYRNKQTIIFIISFGGFPGVWIYVMMFRNTSYFPSS
jgi:hypothetical protein